ncbi:hypothetical protein ACRALDRAFT_206423 [Sodiomyces alcalophilus JCM 7366]|uniref:uncharacterized protein n=1 Tax=Sodiomyces alcalophilus JCM 7366 TaxID=591952 RepID=UPI0039B36C5F
MGIELRGLHCPVAKKALRNFGKFNVHGLSFHKVLCAMRLPHLTGIWPAYSYSYLRCTWRSCVDPASPLPQYGLGMRSNDGVEDFQVVYEIRLLLMANWRTRRRQQSTETETRVPPSSDSDRAKPQDSSAPPRRVSSFPSVALSISFCVALQVGWFSSPSSHFNSGPFL